MNGGRNGEEIKLKYRRDESIEYSQYNQRFRDHRRKVKREMEGTNRKRVVNDKLKKQNTNLQKQAKNIANRTILILCHFKTWLTTISFLSCSE